MPRPSGTAALDVGATATLISRRWYNHRGIHDRVHPNAASTALVVGPVALSVTLLLAPLVAIVVMMASLAVVRLPRTIELLLVAALPTAFPVALVFLFLPALLGPLFAFSATFAATLLVCPLRVKAAGRLGRAVGRHLGVHGLLEQLVMISDAMSLKAVFLRKASAIRHEVFSQ